MADEGTDVSNKEHLTICLRYIDGNSLEAFEKFFGFYEIRNIASDTIVDALKDTLVRFRLSMGKLRGQTFDGASNMLGKNASVSTKMKALQPKALATHCHGHSLNLAVKDTSNECQLLNDTKGTVGEICILVKFSPKRQNLLGEIKENIAGMHDDSGEATCKTIDKLCVTRWTVRARCYKKVIDSYESLYQLWEQSLDAGKLDTDVKGRIIGCKHQILLWITPQP